MWDMERKDAPQAAAQAAFSEDGAASKKDKEEPDAKKPRLGALPPQLMYQHAGHRSQVGQRVLHLQALSANLCAHGRLQHGQGYHFISILQ